MTGTVTNVMTNRGFGFLRGDDNQRYFFHLSALVKGTFADLRLGDRATFERTDGPRGLRAEQVVVA